MNSSSPNLNSRKSSKLLSNQIKLNSKLKTKKKELKTKKKEFKTKKKELKNKKKQKNQFLNKLKARLLNLVKVEKLFTLGIKLNIRWE